MWNEIAQKVVGVTPTILDQMVLADKASNSIWLVVAVCMAFLCVGWLYTCALRDWGNDEGFFVVVTVASLVLLALCVVGVIFNGYHLWLDFNCPEYVKTLLIKDMLKSLLHSVS